MKLLFSWWVGAGVLCALIAGGSSAWPTWSARAGLNLTEWLAVHQRLAEERRLEEFLDRKIQQTVRQINAKTQVLVDLRDQRLTLLESAARFRDLDGPMMGNYLKWSRRHDPGQTDDERWCRQVIRFLRGHRADLAALADRFEAELTDHLAHGSLHLPDPPVTPENIEAAHKLALAAAAEYEFHVGKDEKEKPLELIPEPKLKWSNPESTDVQGCVFLWTREGRPLVVGSINKWFSPRDQWGLIMQHEFHSLAEEPLSAKFHGNSVWTTAEAGLKFVAVPNAAAPPANEVQRRLQLRELAKEFSGVARYRNTSSDTELRLLPQPIHSYAALKQGILEGGLFAFVRGTDPEIFLLVEARGKDAATARWQFAGARMTTQAELRLRHQNKQVWEAELLAWKDMSGSHKLAYTVFPFNKIPDFLKEAVAKPKP